MHLQTLPLQTLLARFLRAFQLHSFHRFVRARFNPVWFNPVLGLLSLVSLLIFVACSPTVSQGPAAIPKKVRIGYQIIPNAEVLAKSLGLAEKKFPTVDIQWTAFPAGWKINAAMLAGEIDLGLVGSLPVSTAIAQQLPLQVYIVHDIIDKNAALAVTKASDIKSMTDLPGKKIAVPFGSTAHFSLLSALAQSGMTAKDVTILDMSLSELLAAWQQNTIDGSFIWQTTLSKLLAAQGSVITTAGEVGAQGAVTADLGTVSNDFFAAYPDFLTGFIEVLDDATKLYVNDPQAAAAAIAPEVSLSPAESLAVMQEIIWLDASQQSSAQYMGTPQAPGAIAQVLKDSADFMAAQQAIPPAPELAVFQASLLNELFTD